MEGLRAVETALLALGLVAVAVALSLYERLGLQGDIMIAVVRSFVQLTAIGFVIEFIFGLENVGYVALLLLVMVGFGGWTTSRRAEGVPRAFLLAAAAIGLAAVSTIGLLLLLQIVPPTAQYLISLGGMVIINSINTASLATQVARATRWFWPSIKGINTAVPNRSPYYRNL
jgi:putative ABC transport system permease protein